MHPSSSRCSVLFSGLLTLALGACQTSWNASPPGAAPRRIQIVSEVTATADVAAVDKETRTVTLAAEDGSVIRLKCGEQVRNFDQIKAGDRLRVHSRQTLTASRPEADPASRTEVAAAAARSPRGAMPAIGIGVGVRQVVKIESVDLSHDLVVFTRPSGELVAHRLATPEGRAFAQGLRIGDSVELVYTEMLALGVEPM